MQKKLQQEESMRARVAEEKTNGLLGFIKRHKKGLIITGAILVALKVLCNIVYGLRMEG